MNAKIARETTFRRSAGSQNHLSLELFFQVKPFLF